VPTKTKPKRNAALAAAVGRDDRFSYQIASAARVNPARFGKIIRGTVSVGPEVQQRIAAALGASVEELFPDG
jgi:hypothetical protein